MTHRNPRGHWRAPLGYLVAASAAVLASSPGAWLGDNRYEQYENPGRFLSRMASVWDPSRGFGQTREEFWPLAAGPIALFRAYGASAATAVHLWHIAVLVLAGSGLWLLVRALDPPGPWTAPVAGLFYMFGAYSAAFLVPTNLYLNYAIAPWLWLAAVHGLRSRSPWRGAAAFALVVFLAGNSEPAGLIYACLYLVLIAAYLVFIDRSVTPRRLIVWGSTAGVLTLLVSAAAIYKTGLGAEVFRQNLRETESPRILNVASSWSETWRGLGSWLTYHRDIRGPATPQLSPLLSQPALIVGTFSTPILALAGLAFSRWRHRLLFGLLTAFGLILMVGLHPIDDPPLYGQLLDAGYEAIPSLGVLRNSYKAGMGTMAGLAVLCGAAVDRLAVWARSTSDPDRIQPRRITVAAGTTLVLAATSFNFWSGSLHNPDWTLEATPSYVTEAASWIDAQGADGRVLVMPDGFRHGFRWGWVNDDVLDAMIARPHAIDVAIHTSRPVPADLLHHVSAHVPSDGYRPGQLAPIVRRLGVDLVMLRNDVDWQTWGQPRPVSYDTFRRDEDFELVASFGEPGEFTTSEADTTLAAIAERELPPIEIYRLRGERGAIARLTRAVPPLLVSGAGAAWPALAEQGWLDGDAPVRYTGELTEIELLDALQAGSAMVMTDTNRRRLELLTLEPVQSWTLRRGEDLLRPVFELFDEPDAETVTEFDGATSVEAIPETFSANPDPAVRPGAAFDGDPATAWEFGDAVAVGQRLRIELEDPRDIDAIAVSIPPRSSRRIQRAMIRMSDGTNIDAQFGREGYQRDLDAEAVNWVEIEVRAVTGAGSSRLAISEIVLNGAPVREIVKLPEDIVRRTQDSPMLRRAVSDAPLSLLFQRAVGDRSRPEERSVRREFATVGSRTFDVSGTLRFAGPLPDEVLSQLSNSGFRATATERLLDRVEFAGLRAIDGDDQTAWIAPGRVGQRLVLEFERRPVESLTVRYDATEAFARPGALLVTTADGEVTTSLPTPICRPDSFCIAEARVPLPRAADPSSGVDGVQLEIVSLEGDAPSNPDRRPIRIVEVTLDDTPNEPLDQSLGCTDALVEVNGRGLSLRPMSSLDELLVDGRVIEVEGCDRLTLEEGTHQLASTSGTLLDQFALIDVDWPTTMSNAPLVATLDLTQPTQTRFVVDIERAPDVFGPGIAEADGRETLVLAQSAHPGWRALADGQPLGPPDPTDTMAGWELPEGTTTVRIEFTPQHGFELALTITILTAMVCLGILILPTRS